MNKVYNCVFLGNAAPKANYIIGFDLNENNIKMKIKSLFFDLSIFDSVTNLLLPIVSQTTQKYYLQLGLGIPGSIGSIFKNATIPANITANGSSIRLNQPKQLFFDSFFINNLVTINFVAWNYDVLNTYYYDGTVVIETEMTEES